MGEADRRRIVAEADDVVTRVAAATGQHFGLVSHLIAAFREAIDDLLASGAIVATGELLLSFGDSPTRAALLNHLREDDDIPQDVLRGDPVATSLWLDLPQTVYDEHPLANRPHVMRRVLDVLGDRTPSLEVLWTILEAWDVTFADGRSYAVSSIGLEAAAERWLIGHLPRLRLHGYPVDLAHQQLVLPSGRRLDLLCRFNDNSSSAETGDWLVVELKATRLYAAAADQLRAYIDEVAEHLADRHAVHGLLITDGADHGDIADLEHLGLAHLSLAALGYRLDLAQDQIRRANASLTSESLGEEITLTASSTEGSEEFDGPETYWVRMFWDQSGTSEDGRQRAAARDLWERRESRRTRYEKEWGDKASWPAQHPTTLLEVPDTPWPQVAVCIRCDWLARPVDLDEALDLRDAAKEHALSHAHDPGLDEGVNPPRPDRPGARGVQAAIDRARDEVRLRARRVQPRPDAEGSN